MIDLHLHFDGSLPPELLFCLAMEQGIKLPAETPEELRPYLSAPVDCPDLNTYLERFALPLQILQTKEALTEAAAGLCSYLAQQGLLYAEIRFAPQSHTEKGLTQREVITAVLDGIDKSPLKANLILCCMRGDTNQKENEETVRLAAEFSRKRVLEQGWQQLTLRVQKLCFLRGILSFCLCWLENLAYPIPFMRERQMVRRA